MLEALIAFLLSLPSVNESPETLADHVASAQAAATPELPAELLLAVAYVESRYDSTATSALVNGVRRTGPRRSRKPPRGVLRSLHCGPTQASAKTWTECLELRNPTLAYIALTDSLGRWLRFARGDMPRALAGYGCGVKGARTGLCNRYPARVMRVQGQIRTSTAVARTPRTPASAESARRARPSP